MYATGDKKLKTDKRDARALAQAAKLGAYKAAHRLSDAQCAVRTQVQVRQALVQMRTKLINQIGAELLRFGCRNRSSRVSPKVRGPRRADGRRCGGPLFPVMSQMAPPYRP